MECSEFSRFLDQWMNKGIECDIIAWTEEIFIPEKFSIPCFLRILKLPNNFKEFMHAESFLSPYPLQQKILKANFNKCGIRNNIISQMPLSISWSNNVTYAYIFLLNWSNNYFIHSAYFTFIFIKFCLKGYYNILVF